MSADNGKTSAFDSFIEEMKWRGFFEHYSNNCPPRVIVGKFTVNAASAPLSSSNPRPDRR